MVVERKRERERGRREEEEEALGWHYMSAVASQRSTERDSPEATVLRGSQ